MAIPSCKEMFIVQLVHPSLGVNVLGFTMDDISARAMVQDCAKEYVRSKCGEERVRERFTRPDLAGVYLVDRLPLAIEIWERQANVIDTPGWFSTTSTITFKDTLVGHVSATLFNPAQLHAQTPTMFPDQSCLPPLSPLPTPTKVHGPKLGQLPANVMNELEKRIKHKIKTQ